MKLNSELPRENGLRKRIEEWGAFYILLIMLLVFIGIWASHQIGEEELPPGHVAVSVSKTKYKLGETVVFTVKNNFSVPIYVNNYCPSEPLNVYRWENTEWKRIHYKTDKSSCSGQTRQITIPPNGAKEYSYKDWAKLFDQAGRYRIAAVIEHYEALPFQDFEVLAPPKVEVKKVIIPATTTTPSTSTQTPSTTKSSSPTNDDANENEVEIGD